jgi:hypothetical protein
LKNESKGASKEVLASWVSAALQKSLTKKNIKNGFRTTCIFPLNPQAMDGKMGPSEFYRRGSSLGRGEVDATAAVDLLEIENI